MGIEVGNMARKRKANGQFVKGSASPRKRSSGGGGSRRKGRKISYKNRSIKGDVAGIVLLGATVASPAGQKIIESVRARSLDPATSWSKEEVIRTGVMMIGGKVGGEILGSVLTKVKPIRHIVNKGKRMLGSVF